MSNPLMQPPLPVELMQQVSQLSSAQKSFLAGYLWALSQDTTLTETQGALQAAVGSTSKPVRKITVISMSQTGNAAGVAKQLTEKLKSEKLDATLVSASSYKARQLVKEDIVLIVTSTQGEGEPPEEGVVIHQFLNGKKAPKLDGLSFAVFGLGDSSYPDFCQAGIDFDNKLHELGAERLLPRADADLEYQTSADEWIAQAVTTLKEVAGDSTDTAAPIMQLVSANQHVQSQHSTQYNKDTPYSASLLQHHPLATEDADKEVEHIEIDLGDSNISYQAGDALGVYSNNDRTLVENILSLLKLDGDTRIDTRTGSCSLHQALIEQVDLNQLTPQFINAYAQTAKHDELSALVADKQKLQEYQAWTPLIALLKQYPQTLDAQRLYDGLKPLTPRLYSIASAQAEVGEEVHLCVGLVDINTDDEHYYGSASGLLCKRLAESDEVRVFVEPNPNFRLPSNPETPIIMIGAGTGIAPFRSFLQQRSADEATGKNWLIFGNRHSRKDFLYQGEWLAYREQNLLHKTSLAFSRDTDKKVYVQDKIMEQAETFWQWLNQGTHIYVCGDALRMAKDVEKAILQVIQEQGKKSADDALEYLTDLREDNRYQRDVY